MEKEPEEIPTAHFPRSTPHPQLTVLSRMEVRGTTGDFGETVEDRFPFNVCVVLPLSVASF